MRRNREVLKVLLESFFVRPYAVALNVLVGHPCRKGHPGVMR